MLATRGDPKSSPPARPRQSRPPLWRDPSAVRASSGWASGLPLLPQTSARPNFFDARSQGVPGGPDNFPGAGFSPWADS